MDWCGGSRGVDEKSVLGAAGKPANGDSDYPGDSGRGKVDRRIWRFIMIHLRQLLEAWVWEIVVRRYIDTCINHGVWNGFNDVHCA
jgi:hypothetical protein